MMISFCQFDSLKLFYKLKINRIFINLTKDLNFVNQSYEFMNLFKQFY